MMVQNLCVCFSCRLEVQCGGLLHLHVHRDSGRLHGHRHGHGHLRRPDGGGHRQHLHDHLLRLHDGNVNMTCRAAAAGWTVEVSHTSLPSSLQIFAGLMVNVSSIVDWLSWLKYFSIPRYGLSVRTKTVDLSELEMLIIDFSSSFCVSRLCRLMSSPDWTSARGSTTQTSLLWSRKKRLDSTWPPPQQPQCWQASALVSRCTGEGYLEKQGIDYSTWGLWQNHMALIIMIFCFLSIAYLKLRFIKKFTWNPLQPQFSSLQMWLNTFCLVQFNSSFMWENPTGSHL